MKLEKNYINKRIIAGVLVGTILGTNTYLPIVKGAEVENTKNLSTARSSNTYEVRNFDQLQRAIDGAVTGDIIKVFPGDYGDKRDVNINGKNGIAIQGTTEDGQVVSDKLDVIRLHNHIKVNSSNITIEGLEVANITASGALESNVILRNLVVTNDLKISNVKNPLIDKCEVSRFLELYGTEGGRITSTKNRSITRISSSAKNTELINHRGYNIYDYGTNTTYSDSTGSIYYGGDGLKAENCRLNLKIGIEEYGTKHVGKNATLKNIQIPGSLEIGVDGNSAENIYMENLDFNTYGTRIKIGYYGRGSAKNITLKNINTKTLGNNVNENILTIGDGGIAENILIDNISTAGSFTIGVNEGQSKNVTIKQSKHRNSIKVGDENSRAENTLLINNNAAVSDNGKDTRVIDAIDAATTHVTGSLPKDSTLVISKGSEELINKKFPSEGYFRIPLKEKDDLYTLNSGDVVRVKIYDGLNNLVCEENVTVLEDNIAPVKPTINEVNNKSAEITGQGERGTTAIVEVSGKEVGRALVNTLGNFKIPLEKPLEEYSEVKVYTVDKSGNKSDFQKVIVKDIIPPEAPRVNTLLESQDYIIGIAEPNALVEVLKDGNKVGSEYASKDSGEFKIFIGRQKVGTIFHVTAKDKALNTSEVVEVKVNKELVSMNTVPTIEAHDINILQGDYFEPRNHVTAMDKEDGVLTNSVKVIENTVDTNVPGEYKVTYEVTDSDGASVTKTIKVTVQRKMVEINSIPKIYFSEYVISEGIAFDPLLYVWAEDEEDGNLTASIKIIENTVDVYKPGVYKVIYQVIDSKGAKGTLERAVEVTPNKLPDLTVWDKEIYVGQEFDPMDFVSAIDWEDGDLTSKIQIVENTVDIFKPGKYKITYKVQDSQGGTTTKTATITVKVKPGEIILEEVVGSNRYNTAIELSKSKFSSADTVVIANGLGLADGLSVTPLAAYKNSPILLTPAEKLPEETKEEIRRLNPKNVIVVGGSGVVSENIVNEIRAMGISNIERLGGKTRFLTSLAIAEYIDKNCYDVNNVVISNGLGEADALSISAAAGRDKMPIILVEKDSIPMEIYNWLKGEDLNNGYIIGGTGVVTDNVLRSINEITSQDISNNRLGGKSRFETNAMVIGKFYGNTLDKVYVTNGYTPVDALASGPIAALNEAPVVLAGNDLSEGQIKVLEGKKANTIVKAGGLVSSSAIENLKNLLR